MNVPRVKRRKLVRGEDDYLPGNITKIELHNFMTFEHVESTPGPRLNLVIGPNGSGKSSIVCAIALGLGGEPQLLGRASSVGAYVKRGEDSGYIRISLRGDSKDDHITIMRKIDTRNKSEWLLKGKVVAKKDVIEIIQRFNIQVNNLTQFLPQDRVCEFAKLTPVRLLEETEKAVGDPQLPLQHRALIEKSSELKKIKTAVEQKGESLSQMKALNAELERDVERVRQREEFLAKAESMKKKLPWLKYDVKKSEYLEAQEQRRHAKKKLDEAAKTLNNLKEPIDKQKKEKAALDGQCKKFSGIINDNAKKRMELLENENHLGVQVQGKHKEISELRRQEESRQQRISQAKEDLVAAELELKNMPLYEPPKDKIDSLGSEILEVEASANQKRLQKSEKQKLVAQKRAQRQNCLDKLKDMENRNNKLLEALRKSGAERIFEAYRLVQEHREDFNKEVYGPILLEVKVSDQVHADYLEGHVPYYIWKSFITQDAHDRDLLVRNLKAFDIPILNYSGDANYNHKEPFQVSEETRACGICSRLDQVFDAPDAVKEVLISQFGLDRSYIGSRETDQRADEVSKLGIFDFWTPENHYRWSTSRYGGHVSASVEAVDRSRLISYSSDVGEIEKLKSQKMELEETITGLDDDIRLLQSEQRQLEDEAAKLHKQREEIITKGQFEKRKRREMENRVDQRRKKLEAIDKQDDVDTAMAKLIDQIAKLNSERFRCALRIKKLLVDAVACKRKFAAVQMASIEFDAKIRELEVDLKHHEKFAEDAALHFGVCESEEDKYRKHLASAKSYAESVALLTPELKKAFIEMPQTIEELEAAIQDNVSQANSILLLNHNILEEYERRRQQIEGITIKLEADKKQLESYLAEIDTLKEKWLPTLRNLVAQINETFSHNFQEMAVAGEVLLDEHDMEFDQYGILIKVKFRQAGQLQVLSAHHQSGGERSVSTILYLISLQDLTNCPFRVVDEINQGMDPINERKMFQQLVRAASQLNTPQCFLLTPKLLPDLEYSEACSILNIMNGPWIKQPSEVWKNGGRWGSIMGLVGGENQ